jgi:hypothetical protein
MVDGPIAETEATGSGMRRSGSWIWDWKQSPPSSNNSSKHGGKTFGGMFTSSPPSSKNSSKHGGMKFAAMDSTSSAERTGFRPPRNASFSDLAGGMLTDDPDRQAPRSREASGHGGNLFANAFKRTNSFIWDWRQSPVNSTDTTPNSSRNNSKHGGTLFRHMSGEAAAPETEQPKMRRNASWMWDWSKYRGTPPQTPNASLHGGNAWADGEQPAEGEGEDGEGEQGQLNQGPALEPPAAMRRNMSLGSFSACHSQPVTTWPMRPALSL